MQGYRRTNSGQKVDLTGVAELLFGRSGGGGLDKFSESCASVGEAPGRQFDTEGLERIKNLFTLAGVHRDLSHELKVQSYRHNVTNLFRVIGSFAMQNVVCSLSSSKKAQRWGPSCRQVVEKIAFNAAQYRNQFCEAGLLALFPFATGRGHSTEKYGNLRPIRQNWRFRRGRPSAKLSVHRRSENACKAPGRRYLTPGRWSEDPIPARVTKIT